MREREINQITGCMNVKTFIWQSDGFGGCNNRKLIVNSCF